MHHDLSCEVFEPIRAEEKTGFAIDVRRHRLPLLAAHRLGVEDRPDRSTAIVSVADPGQRRIDEVAWIVFDVLGVQIRMRLVWIHAHISVVVKMTGGLVIEPLAEQVDQNDVLPVLDRKPDSPRHIEHCTSGIPAHVDITVLAADRSRLGNARTELGGIVEQPPKRGANVHRGKLAAGVLIGPRHAGEPAIFFGESRVEHAAKVDIAG